MVRGGVRGDSGGSERWWWEVGVRDGGGERWWEVGVARVVVRDGGESGDAWW